MLLLCALIAGNGSVWADNYSVTYNYSDLKNMLSGNYADASSYWKVPETAGNTATIAIPITVQPTSNISITFHFATFGSGTNPSSSNTTITAVGTETESSWSGSSVSSYPSSSTYVDGVMTITKPTAPTTLGGLTITMGVNSGVKIFRLQSITVSYEYTASSVATPTFSPVAGTYTSTQSVTLSCDTEGATIYYTLDGSAPTSSSSVYSSAISVSETTTIKAIAKKGDDVSAVGSATYTILPVTHAGTSADPYTVTDARNALTAGTIITETDYYVKGYITKKNTISSGKLTYWLSDDGKMTSTIQCYNGKYVDGADFTDATDLEVGDIATVKGKLAIYSGSTYQFNAGNEVVDITPRTKVNIATFTATTNTLILEEAPTTTTTVTNDQAGCTSVSYTYESNNVSVATVDENGIITAVAKGTAIITVTPVVSATDPTYKVGESKSIEITVKNPSHTATFSVNGVTSEVSVEEGEAITFPAAPAAIGGKDFVGWTAATIDGTISNAPAFVESATMGNENVTYYAVFASGTKTNGWKKLAASEVSEEGIYALLTTDGHAFNGSISSGHGQATTDAFSFTNNIATSAPTGTCEITLQKVTGGYKMYNADKKYLYASKAGSGGLAWHDSEESYWSYNNENWEYQKNYSGSKARLRGYNNGSFRTYSTNNGDVLVFAQKTTISTYSAYCTSIPSTIPATLNASGYATFASTYPLDFTDDSKFSAWQVTGITGNAITFEQITGAVAAGTGVLLKGTASTGINIPVADSGSDISDTNKLKGITTATVITAEQYYGLSGNSFVKVNAGTVPAGKALLPASEVPSNARLTFVFEDAQGIRTIEHPTMTTDDTVYNLKGQRVVTPKKGLYIMNGKKVMVK